MDPLASSEDVVTQLGRDLTTAEEDRVVGILAKASALFRDRSGQEFTPGESTVRLKVEGGRIRLEQVPAVAVSAAVDDDGIAVDYELSGQWLSVSRDGTPLVSHTFVTVIYSHGDAVVPDLVRITIAEIAAKVLRVDSRAAAGVQTGTRSALDFSETLQFAPWAVGGTTLLSPEDAAIADSFRYRGTKVIVCQP